MATITTRTTVGAITGKGSALTHTQLDTNFSQFNSSGSMVINGTYGSATAYANWGGRLLFNGADSDAEGNYFIGTNGENYGGSYSKLDLRWHTGQRFGSQEGYGGSRFFSDEDLSTLRVHINAGSGYTYLYPWTKLATSGVGFFADTNSAHWHPNDLSTYGAWATRGSRGGWYGIHFYGGGSTPHLMFDGSSNGGFYYESSGRWALYYNHNNVCWGVGSSTTSSSYYLYVSGAIYSTSDIVAYSDARAKENVYTIDNPLSKLSKMRGVYYNMISDESKRRRVGVIAQETLEALPEVVSYDKDNDKYGVDYGNITGLLIEAVKELKEQVDALKLKLGEA